MAYRRSLTPHRYSVSLVTQGKHRFYTLTVQSDVLANTCFVTTRDEDPIKGFQRMLDQKRAQQIADYIDMGFGTIPTSIVLSAQPSAHLEKAMEGTIRTVCKVGGKVEFAQPGSLPNDGKVIDDVRKYT